MQSEARKQRNSALHNIVPESRSNKEDTIEEDSSFRILWLTAAVSYSLLFHERVISMPQKWNTQTGSIYVRNLAEVEKMYTGLYLFKIYQPITNIQGGELFCRAIHESIDHG